MKKSAFFYSNLTALILTVITIVVYSNSVAREHSAIIIAAMVVAAIANAVLLVKRVPYGEYLPFALDLVGVAVFVTLAFDEIGDVLSKVNMDGLSVSWIASAALIVITSICAGINTIQAQK